MKAIELINLTKKYGKQEVLNSFSLDVDKGKCLAIMGESGSGKSTIAKIIIGLEKQNSGTVKIFGKIIISILAMFITHLIGSDYLEYGIMTVLVFYFFRSRKWWNFVAQVILLTWINIFLIPRYDFSFYLFGNKIYAPVQSFAIFSLVFIWLYRRSSGRLYRR
mgnify:CR=1 FL=1